MQTEFVKLVLTPFNNGRGRLSHPQVLKPYFDLYLETITVRKLRISEYLLCYMETRICKSGLHPASNMGVAGSHPLNPYVDLSLETSNGRKLKISEYLLCYMGIVICKVGIDPPSNMGVAGSPTSNNTNADELQSPWLYFFFYLRFTEIQICFYIDSRAKELSQ